MSVLASKRGRSAMEFMNTAFELEKFTMTAVHRENVIPKRYRLTKGMDLMNSARIIGNNVVYANSIFPHNKEDYQRRISFQKRAILEIQIMLKDLRLITEVLPVKECTTKEWTRLLLLEEDCIKSWMKSDKARFGKIE